MANTQVNTTEKNNEIATQYHLTEEETRHLDILSKVSVLCRSNRNGFVDETRLQEIDELLQDSPYNECYHGSLCRMYSKKPLSEIGDNVILVSSHVDTVYAITECSSKLDPGTGWLRGTYDNQSTNAAAVIAMKEMEMPDNVVFAFTGEEETGAMRGAHEAAEMLHGLNKKIFAIALDVTPDGFDENVLNTIENCVVGGEKALNNVAQAAVYLEPEDNQAFLFVKADSNNIPTEMDKKYLSRTTGMCDEAYGYRSQKIPTLSFCLPCGDGYMHSNRGVAIKAPVFEGYVLSLASFVWSLQHTFPYLEYKSEIIQKKLTLIEKAGQIELPKKPEPMKTQPVAKNTENSRNFYYSGDRFLDDDDYEDEEDKSEDFDTWCSYLRAEALTYDANERDFFVEDVDIPWTFLYDFCANPEEEITEAETNEINDFLEDIFDQAHELGKYQKESPESQTEKTGFFGKIKQAIFHNYDEEVYDDYDSGL